MVEEANPSDPDYIAAKERHGQELEMRVRKLMIQRGVIIPPDNTGWQAEVAELKAFWLETYGAELEGNEKDLYVSHIAIGTDSDYLELVEAITRRSQPTEGEVAAAKATFQG